MRLFPFQCSAGKVNKPSKSTSFLLLIIATLGVIVSSQIIDLSPEQFNNLLRAGDIDLLIDVRTQNEYTIGHVQNSTLISNLGPILAATPPVAVDSTLLFFRIKPCSRCTTVVYGSSAASAQVTLETLQDIAGFTGPLYNGQGVEQWTEAGYPLVRGNSTASPCMRSTDLADPEAQFCSEQGPTPLPPAPTATTAPGPTSPPAPQPTTTIPQTPVPTSAAPVEPPPTGPIGPTGPPVKTKKVPQQPKCGSLALERGGAGGQQKDCVSRLTDDGGRRRMKLRGL